MVVRMATKITITVDEDSLWLAREAAERSGLALSTWISRAARDAALRACPGPSVTEKDQRADELEQEAEETAHRAAR